MGQIKISEQILKIARSIVGDNSQRLFSEIVNQIQKIEVFERKNRGKGITDFLLLSDVFSIIVRVFCKSDVVYVFVKTNNDYESQKKVVNDFQQARKFIEQQLKGILKYYLGLIGEQKKIVLQKNSQLENQIEQIWKIEREIKKIL